jgi:hypothetical protein
MPASKEDARLIAAMGRHSLVTLSFDIDQSGQPVKFGIETATEPVWGTEAISFVRRWRFSPGTRDGYPVEVPCRLYLAWGEKPFTDRSLLRASQESDAMASVQSSAR